MPTVYSRHDKFALCMDDYMSGYDACLKEDDPEFVPDLSWELQKTGNTGNNVAIYTLDIHRKYTAYTVDATFVLDGVEYPAGPVIKTNRHTFEGFNESFNKYFKEYERRDAGGKLLAGVKAYEATEVNDDILRHSIYLRYNNNTLLPFPVPHQCLSLLEAMLYDEVEELTIQLTRLKTRDKRLRRQIGETKETAAVNAGRAQEKYANYMRKPRKRRVSSLL